MRAPLPLLAPLLAALTAAAPAHAAEEYVPGLAGPIFTGLGAMVAALPYILLRDARDPGLGFVGGRMGVSERWGAFGMDIDAGGYPTSSSPFGWIGRARMDIAGEPLIKDGHLAWRFDGLALIRAAGDPRGPLSLEGLVGFAVWPRLATEVGRDLRAFAGIGPVAGVRVRAWSIGPSLMAELELDYAPLLGAPLSERLHHLEVTSNLAWFPWSAASPGFELLLRRGLAWGGDQPGLVADTAVLGGVRAALP